MRIFVSHSRRDSSFVQALGTLLRVALRLPSEEIRITSLEDMQLEAGVNLEKVLRDEVLHADVLLAVLSPNSLSSTYVQFELGARWGADKRTVPLLVGMKANQVDPPLNSLHVVECDRSGLLNVLDSIAKILGIEPERAGSLQNPIEEVLNERESIAPRQPLAYAVLSYVLDSNGKFALLKDRFYKTIQPAGRRLIIGEQPHEVALEMAHRELDLSLLELKAFPPAREKRFKAVKIVPPPYQVQLEQHTHRAALAHYDFVYVFSIEQQEPSLHVRISDERKFDPAWYTLEEVEARKDHKEWGPHEDMIETMHAIRAQYRA